MKHRFVVEIETTEETEHLDADQLKNAVDSAICYWVEEGVGPFRDEESGKKLWANWKVSPA